MHITHIPRKMIVVLICLYFLCVLSPDNSSKADVMITAVRTYFDMS